MTLNYYDMMDNFIGSLDVEITAEDIVDYVIDLNYFFNSNHRKNIFKTLTENRNSGIKFIDQLLEFNLINIDELEEDESFIEFMKDRYGDELED